MFRRMLIAAAATAMFVGLARAEELTATVKAVNADKSTITFTINGDEKTMTVSKDAEIYTQLKGKKNKPGPKQPLAGGLSDLKVGTEVTIMTFKNGDDEIVSSIAIDPSAKKKK
jgi:uncharacterized protein (DUF2141 family)